ncbi:reprolysin-like metallopeptidase [Flavobacterium sp. LB2P53]|uniref:reprolysin-like metallopeptidase n=1 Tax=Flavobacterium sp. LB2P53 TaxID=2497481 RepID=UPI000F81FECC|nr:zinc-dependent metalloprotease family protein [Flavobacterium sp. LB2P53]RTY70571.1 T9SS type A sorting domain-containing protein [Flavobacterium sp. LB2P53]
MNTKNNFLLPLLFCFSLSISWGQNKSDWTALSENSRLKINNISFDKEKMPTKFKLYTVGIASVKNKLQNTPKRGVFFGTSQNIINVPNEDGSVENYQVLDAQILHPDLAAKLPNIKSYVGSSLVHPGKYIRFSLSQAGFHAQVFEAGKSTYFIDPYTSDKSVYIAYKRDDLVNNSSDVFTCETDNSLSKKTGNTQINKTIGATDDSKIRLYELAMSCTGEYGALFIGNATTDFEKKSNIMAQMVVTMTRVNGIYEKELGITYQFVPKNFDIMYYDGTTDPWGTEYNDQTQLTIDANIGDANYDIGHNFNTAGGGNAGCIGCVCNSGNKGSGMTGRSNPTGDSFDVDYVAHEIGHQMGGYHTHNGTTTCLKSGNNTEVEPGSGSSIMGYAGICTGQNVQANSDDYFNYVNIRDISANIQGGVSSACFDEIKVSNLPPKANAGANYSIPVGTAFQLSGTGSDPDSGDLLTYTWEQNDNEEMQSPIQPLPTSIQGPMFRTRRGTTKPNRYFPQLTDILSNNLMPTWEVIPQVQRSFEFAFTVRDNVVYGGQTAADLMTLNTIQTAGPFKVSSQNSNTTWIQGETQLITWDVAKTNLLPVNCLFVNILFSALGDFTDTIILADKALNSGSKSIIVPSSLTESGRLMIKAADNVFLDVNDATIIIKQVTTPTFFLTALEVSKIQCANDNKSTFSFDYIPSAGFTGVVRFAATGLPSGSTASFTPTTASTSKETILMTVSGFSNSNPKDYSIIFAGTSPSETKTQVVVLTLKGGVFSEPVLSSPANTSVKQSTYPSYIWSKDGNNSAEFFDVEVASDSNFQSIVETATVSKNGYNQNKGLSENTLYYWRVRPKNECANGVFSRPSSFTTGSNKCFSSTNTIPSVIVSTLTTTSTMDIAADIPISDINVSMKITHGYIGDIVAVLTSPSGTNVSLIASKCDSNPDLDATFDDQGLAVINCSLTSPAISGVLKPAQPLSAFNGESAMGEWTLSITDTGLGDDGILTSWAIAYCGVESLSLSAKKFDTSLIRVYPNPAKNSITVQFEKTQHLDVAVFDLLGRQILSTVLKSSSNTIDVSSLSSGTYIMQLIDDENNKTSKKIIIE